jgi:hypothetical protein
VKIISPKIATEIAIHGKGFIFNQSISTFTYNNCKSRMDDYNLVPFTYQKRETDIYFDKPWGASSNDPGDNK